MQVPDKVTLDYIMEWATQIKSYTTRLRDTVDTLREAELNKTYREGSWNVRQLVHHIADSQLNMFQRLKMALTNDNPTVPNFIQDTWAVQSDTKLSVESSIKMLADSLTEEQLQLRWQKLAWHEEHYLAHIKNVLSD